MRVAPARNGRKVDIRQKSAENVGIGTKATLSYSSDIAQISDRLSRETDYQLLTGKRH
jgi:hypothetical protein